jgi:DNA-binding GntR family transcriptional regulator
MMDIEIPQKPQMGGATEHATQRLLMLIMCGELSPGEQIRQQEMAEQFGVSRVPLREALNVLAQQGLLVHRPNQGYFVAKRGPGELAQIRRMLFLLENEVMQGLEWPDQAMLEQLRALNGRMKATVHQQDWSDMPPLNREFHNLVLTLSPYQLIVDEIRRLFTLADPFFAAKFERPSARLRTVEEHEMIVGALQCKDRAALLRAMEAHRNSNVEGLSQAMASQQSVVPTPWDAELEQS